MVLEEGNDLVLDGIDGWVKGMVGQPVKIDGERVLSKHGDKKEVLKIIRNSSFESTVEIELNSLVVGDHPSIEF